MPVNNLGGSGFDGIKTSMECSPGKFDIFESKSGPMRTLSFKTHTNFELRSLRGCVFCLHTCLDPSELFIDGRVTARLCLLSAFVS